MEVALQLLLNLVPLAAPISSSGQLLLVPRPDLFDHTLREFVPQAQVPETAALLRQITEGAVVMSQVFAQLQRLAAHISDAVAASGDEAGLELVVRQLGLLQAINQQPASGRTVQHIHLRLDEAVLSPIVREWHLHDPHEQHETVIMHRADLNDQALDFRPSGTSFIKRRVSLQYQPGTTSPLVELQAPSATAIDATPRTRPLWRQPPHPDYDLSVYTEQMRFAGTICTRLIDVPSVIEGQFLTLAIPAGTAQVVATEVYDQQKTLLVRVFCWPNQAL